MLAYGLCRKKRQAVGAEAARAERASAREPSPAPDHLRYGGMTQAPLVRQLFAGLGGANSSGGGNSVTGFARAASGAKAQGAVGNRIVIGGGRGGTGEATVEGRRGGERGGGRGAAKGGRPPSGGSGDAPDGFSSTLEHHRQNVIAVTVPPVQAVGAGGFVPETLIKGSGGGGSGKG